MEDDVLVSPETTSGDTEQDEFSSIRERFEAGEQLADDEMDKIADPSTTVTTGSSSSTSTAATSPSLSAATVARSTPCRWSSPPS